MPVNGQWLVESQLWATIRQNGQGRGEGGGVKGGGEGGGVKGGVRGMKNLRE